ncbi:putative protein FAM47D [Seriola lalandi dorsalis]|uniref:Uncharacterized protein n=1 Tax=Seriola lalandi dorsalis TaxID=1841481 RepID=A0A3B4WT56_SERLL|nr:putative protein FAM47D [Seriola lalandi dorsalis]XP_056232732.1 putative protein FAM47D isoform X1 [Seriola aureovittata]
METKNTQPTFPWYKERLQTKYLKAPTNKISSVSSSWRFVNVNLDDCSSVLSEARRGVSPVIFHNPSNHSSTQKPRKSIPKEHACFSKQMIRKQIRREYVASVEGNIKQHPLAMYPHYKDHMTAELFDKVVSILDPDMCVNSASSLPTPTTHHAEEEEEEEHCKEPSKEDISRAKQGKSANKISSDVQSPSPGNPYILQMNGNGIKKGQKVKVNQLSNHEDMKVATKLFSRWFVSPDEEINVPESPILQHSSSTTFPI